jgi:membrane-bound lytic murein transglycosylase D
MTPILLPTLVVLTMLLSGCETLPNADSRAQDPNRQTQASAPAPLVLVETNPVGQTVRDVTQYPAPPMSTANAPVKAPTAPPPAISGSGRGLQPSQALQISEDISLRVAQIAAPEDIWARIRSGFAIPDLDSDLVRKHEQLYGSRPDYILRMTERSRRYMFHIVEELERRNMPTELALLPFIESAFNPQAVSHAKAAGMWQFMPATGKYFDLHQNVFRDERRDVLESTRAALDYLQKLHGMFGDWHLALAAYNWGEGSVSRALSRNRQAGLGLQYTDLRMPLETQNYVPKLQAVKNIVADPDAFQVELPLIHNHPYFQTVAVERDMDVAVAARLAQISIEDFRALNPALNRPLIMAAGTPNILLPWENADVFVRRLEELKHQRLASWTAWAAPSTMKVTEAARLHGLAESEFRSVNQLPARTSTVRAGATYLIPRRADSDRDVSEQLANTRLAAYLPDVVLRTLQVRAGKNQNLSGVARQYGVSAENMAAWNKLPINVKLREGQKLIVLIPTSGKKSNKAKASTARKKTSAPAPRTKAKAKDSKTPPKKTNKK